MPTDSTTWPVPPSRPDAGALTPGVEPPRQGFRLALAAASMVALHVALLVVFYAVLAPVAILRRAAGLRGIGAGPDARAASYWRRSASRRSPP